MEEFKLLKICLVTFIGFLCIILILTFMPSAQDQNVLDEYKTNTVDKAKGGSLVNITKEQFKTTQQQNTIIVNDTPGVYINDSNGYATIQGTTNLIGLSAERYPDKIVRDANKYILDLANQNSEGNGLFLMAISKVETNSCSDWKKYLLVSAIHCINNNNWASLTQSNRSYKEIIFNYDEQMATQEFGCNHFTKSAAIGALQMEKHNGVPNGYIDKEQGVPDAKYPIQVPFDKNSNRFEFNRAYNWGWSCAMTWGNIRDLGQETGLKNFSLYTLASLFHNMGTGILKGAVIQDKVVDTSRSGRYIPFAHGKDVRKFCEELGSEKVIQHLRSKVNNDTLNTFLGIGWRLSGDILNELQSMGYVSEVPLNKNFSSSGNRSREEEIALRLGYPIRMLMNYFSLEYLLSGK